MENNNNNNVREIYETFIHQSRYARWLPEKERRESWFETVKRYVDNILYELSEEDIEVISGSIFKKEVMPSMRAMMTAGPALNRDNLCAYNCSYLPIEDPKCFDELLYILMCGVGVGYSVERQYINKLPEVAEGLHETNSTIEVSDSKIGWASAFRELVALLYSGKIPGWDMRKVRPAGSVLRTFGGRASGPSPLDDLFKFTVRTFKRAAGRRLNSLECHDLCCKIASVVVVGGVRRSALISLSNLTDQRMAKAKQGEWYREEESPFRAYANNSVAYTERPDVGAFLEEWSNIYKSKAGERGIFSRAAAAKQAAKYGRREESIEYGTNPCSEIILRPYQLCNLTEVIVRPTDTETDLFRKVRVATILGTAQAKLTDFKYVRKRWSDNCKEEALLGVSLTGIYDNPILRSRVLEEDNNLLSRLRAYAQEVNEHYAKLLGVNPSAAITCIKPSGTVSQLCSTSSGIHPSYSEFYIRRVRQDEKDPLTKFLIDQGVPYETDKITRGHMVFNFPMESPFGSLTRDSVSALDQLELWKKYAEAYCEHKPSITVYVKDEEQFEVLAWVYANWDIMSGVAFLPYSDHIYEQAPYEPITEEKYKELLESFPKVNWEDFISYEMEDNTISSQELACVGGACEI